MPYERASTPDTEISDGDLDSSPPAKRTDGDKPITMDYFPALNATTHSLDGPGDYRPTPASVADHPEAIKTPIVATSPTKYSLKPTDLVGAVEDFSAPVAITPKTNPSTIHKLLVSDDDHAKDPLLLYAKRKIAPLCAPANAPVNKKQKILSPRRRRQANRQAVN